MFFRKPTIMEKDKGLESLLTFGHTIVYAIFRMV
jgi:hypothetical protein